MVLVGLTNILVSFGQTTYLVENLSTDPGDGRITLLLDSSQIDQVQWTAKQGGLHQLNCDGLQEGVAQEIRVQYLTGAIEELSIFIPAQSAQEHLNNAFIPLVDFLYTILLWDPFEAIGIYDPVVYQSDGSVLLHPNGTPV